ncbi:hypothetical protein NQ315_013151 [Exocentrus adspersus]|uniref:Thioredoxin domain-containing protein 17 n=1 Tax=Exocentrus adspersus TaxID=1586481 RepID=A0AAV8VWX1_9CUCU|nr:hypothetical protein NQ315_013151 [Exocentrus adspersus]
MVKKHHVEGYENFCKFIKELDSEGQVVYVYFCGSKLENGESWCDDCQRAKPVIQKELENADPNAHFVYVEVGGKILIALFRKDPKTKLLVLPTIIKWKCPQRLEGDQCEKPELVNLLFTEED